MCGIDSEMDMGHTLISGLDKCIACVVVAFPEGAFPNGGELLQGPTNRACLQPLRKLLLFARRSFPFDCRG